MVESAKEFLTLYSMENFKDILSYDFATFKSVHLSLENIFTAIVILILAKVCLFIIKKIIIQRLKKVSGTNSQRIDSARLNSVYQIARYLTWIIAISLALDSIGIQLTILIAGSAALMVGVGLGLQQIFNDIISGLFLLFEGSVKVGDIIETEGIVARVVKINLRTSNVVTRDNIAIIIPNHFMITEKVINWSHNESFTRFSIKFTVEYGSDLDLVKKICLEAVHAHPKVINEKNYPTLVRLTEFGDKGIEIETLFWSSDNFMIENIQSDIRFSLNRKLRENHIFVPLPQRVVHMKS